MFAIVARDELWILGPHPALRERRLSHGRATLSGLELMADDSLPSELLAVCDRELRTAIASLPQIQLMMMARVVVTVRHAAADVIAETTIALSFGKHSLITTPDMIADDARLLADAATMTPELTSDYRGVSLLWKNGSGSVLLHEAAGHPAEHRKPAIEWPSWLSVRDEPRFETDDTGRPVKSVDLLRGEEPSSLRRASFASVPLRRLSNVVVRQQDAPFEIADRRIEVLLVEGGRYDPLTDEVTLFIPAADLIEGSRRRRLEPFIIHESRDAIPRAMRGAEGPPVRYPGVICSSEGQEIAVGSHAPALLTLFL